YPVHPYDDAVSNTESWDRIAARARSDSRTDVVRYGPDGPTESELRLIGDVKGKRVLDLGSGPGQAAIAMAKQGAIAIAVDASAAQLERGQKLAMGQEVRLEWHKGDLADLHFLRADSIDLAFSASAISEVEDLDRLFRQVHRVLRPHSVFVFSYEHPMALCIGREAPSSPTASTRPVVLESYFSEEPLMVERDGEPIIVYQRPISEVFAALFRAGFRVEVIVEPRPKRGDIPQLIVWRARKEGI
ncbi:MAG TPA: methyltransferase domain-containing protein, partial [Acidimicrobiia bacterium]|nr:methyltransferase domain-containing protein [Acidimicrobiia bacterium]